MVAPCFWFFLFYWYKSKKKIKIGGVFLTSFLVKKRQKEYAEKLSTMA